MMKRVFQTAILGVTLAAALFGTSKSVQADYQLPATNLQALVDLGATGFTTESGLRYYNFFYAVVLDPSDLAPLASQIEVIASGTTLPGFDALSFSSTFATLADQSLAVSIFYDVQVVSGSGIAEASLNVDGESTGTGAFSVQDKFGGRPEKILVTESVSTDVLVFGAPLLSSLSITKVIVLSGGANGTSGIDTINQGIVRGAGIVPEPASLMMLALGGLGVAGTVRRRKLVQA